MSAVLNAPWIARQTTDLLAQRGHAWLLQGPSGLGQYELALALASAWLCEKPGEHGACGDCPSCHAIAVRTHADLAVLMPETQMIELGWPLSEKAQAEIDDKKRKPSKEIRVEAMRDAVEERRAWERERKAKQRAAQKPRESGAPAPSDSKGLPPMSHRDRGGTVPWDKGGTEGGTPARDTGGTTVGDTHAAGGGLSQVVSQAPDPARPVPEDVSLPHAGASARTHEHTGLRVEELVTALRVHSKGAVLVSGASDSTVALTLQRTLTDLAAGPEAVTRADLDTLAQWYAAGAKSFRGTPPGLREIAMKGGTLAEHIEAARAWDRVGRPDPRATPSAPSRTPGAPGRPGSAPARPTRLRPAPPSPASAFLDDNNPLTDPLLGLL